MINKNVPLGEQSISFPQKTLRIGKFALVLLLSSVYAKQAVSNSSTPIDRDLTIEDYSLDRYALGAKTMRSMAHIMAQQASQVSVNGNVTTSAGSPLAGVSIVLQSNPSIGTSTDAQGNFSLQGIPSSAVLIFSQVGYTVKQVPLAGNTTLKVILEETNETLEEVVVVGYGTQKKSNLTGAVDVVDSKQLANRPSPNLSMMLQGAAPNTNIALNSFGGEPGAKQVWQIRGVGSISGNTSPLILVDGVESNVDLIDPDAVESVSILKDASASAVYGSRAAFGVVLITTKKGRKNESTKVEYSNNLSLNSPIYVPSMESSLTYATAFNQAAINAGVTPTFPAEQVDRIKGYIDGTYLTEYNPDKPPYSLWRGRWDGNANYNWTEEYYKSSFLQQKHNVSVTGGGEKSQFYVNAGIFDQPGAATWGDDQYKRYNFLANLNTSVADWLSFNFSTRYGRSDNNLPLGMVGLDRTYTWSQFINFWPTMPKYNVDGSIANPLMLVLEEGGRIKTTDHDLLLNIGTEIEPIKGWKTNISYKYNLLSGTNAQNPKPVYVPIPNGTTGNIGEAASGYRSIMNQSQYNLFTVFSSYEQQVDNHAFKVLLGYEQDVNTSNLLNGYKMNLITNEVPSISTATGDFTLDDNMAHWSTQGVFGRLNYNFEEKYLLEASARYDGSSRFASARRWGFFPSFSAGYNISKEDFWTPIQPIVNTFKVRASYGSLGNQNVDNYLYLATIPIQYRRILNNSTNPGYIIGNEIPLYASAPGLISPDLTWETITTLNVGADATFLDNKLNVVFDWYNRTTSDMLGPAQQLPSTIGATLPRMNNAELSTKGFELSVAWNDQVNEDFSYNARFTLADSRTQILEYNNESGLIDTWYKGQQYGDIWGLTTDRIMQDASESMPNQSFYHANWGPGDMIYKDLDNNNIINEGSRTLNDHGDLSIIANSMPRYMYGLNLGVTYKNWDVSMFWQGIAKRDFLPSTTSEYFWGLMAAPANSGLFEGGKMLDYWRPADETNILGANTDSYFAKPYFSQERNKNTRDQSRYVLNASYLRMKNVQVGYTLPAAALQKIGISRSRIYVSGENLLTFSKLPKLYDPETAVASSPREGGVDMGEIYPINRMFSFGLNVSF